jgi:glycosyltransferase involved in cell wall biosynthesis
VLAGSPFAADTLRAERPDIAAKIRVLPYCYDEALFGAQPAPRPVASAEPVRFLMVGQITPRKGIHLLLPAFDRLPAGSATLTLVGPVGVPQAVLARYADRVTIIPTVPRSQVPAIMAAHHVLVFPSYFEGSALSLIEGLASGLALIQSRNAGNGVTPATGLLLDELSVDALAEAMLAPVRDRDRLDAWRGAAQAEAHRYRFAAYRDNIARLLAGELDGH